MHDAILPAESTVPADSQPIGGSWSEVSCSGTPRAVDQTSKLSSSMSTSLGPLSPAVPLFISGVLRKQTPGPLIEDTDPFALLMFRSESKERLLPAPF
ncbi:unnamed protein product [Boreogadus saida]